MLIYLLFFAGHLSPTVAGDFATTARNDDDTIRIVRLLDELPSVGGLQSVALEPSTFRKRVERMNETMLRLADYDTASLRKALAEIFDRAVDAKRLTKGEESLANFLNRHPVRSSREPGESLQQYTSKLLAEARMSRDFEIWVDRFLFDAPDDEPYKEGSPFHQIAMGSPRTKLWTRIDRLFPLENTEDGITMAHAPLQIDEGGASVPRPEEFDFYSKHYPRRHAWHFQAPPHFGEW